MIPGETIIRAASKSQLRSTRHGNDASFFLLLASSSSSSSPPLGCDLDLQIEPQHYWVLPNL
jgi:hypothetical protein